uniref:ORF1 n=1 Tax=Lentinula edodes negative-strand RNA virus 1 TaxID=2547430 RepID=A0A7S6Z3H8_9MONO|nr:ORF1 [Lentinula edodes negative-strand RNA virus 1]
MDDTVDFDANLRAAEAFVESSPARLLGEGISFDTIQEVIRDSEAMIEAGESLVPPLPSAPGITRGEVITQLASPDTTKVAKVKVPSISPTESTRVFNEGFNTWVDAGRPPVSTSGGKGKGKVAKGGKGKQPQGYLPTTQPRAPHVLPAADPPPKESRVEEDEFSRLKEYLDAKFQGIQEENKILREEVKALRRDNKDLLGILQSLQSEMHAIRLDLEEEDDRENLGQLASRAGNSLPETEVISSGGDDDGVFIEDSPDMRLAPRLLAPSPHPPALGVAKAQPAPTVASSSAYPPSTPSSKPSRVTINWDELRSQL